MHGFFCFYLCVISNEENRNKVELIEDKSSASNLRRFLLTVARWNDILFNSLLYPGRVPTY